MKFHVLAAAGFLVLFSISCTSTPKSEQPQKKNADTGMESADQKDAVNLTLPAKASASYFHSISNDVMEEIMDGSPDSLKAAAAGLRKASIDYSEQEKVLLTVAAGIMRIAWPTERVSWEIPAPVSVNAYTGALDSAEKGVYDSSTGNNDFLTLVLPSLVLLTNTNRKDYFDDAEQALKLAKGIKDDSVLANYLLGTLYVRQGRNAEALKCFTAAAAKAPECMQVSFAMAVSLRDSGQPRQAFDTAEKFASKYPDNISILKLCAETSFSLGNYSAAELYVARVLQQNPSDLSYVLFRARILVEENDYIKASSLLDVYARSDTSSCDYLMLRARIQRDWNKNLPGAVDTMSHAVSLYPDNKDVILFAAEIAAASGEKIDGKSSGELAEQILLSDPSNIAALEISIKDLVRVKRWQEAYIASSGLIKKADAPADSIYTHIQICLALSRNDEAWNLVSGLYARNPSDEQVVQAYLEVMYAMGKRSESMELITALLSSSSIRFRSFLYYRRSFLVAGEQAVLADLRSSLIANPRNGDALYRLYTIYYDKKDYRKAQYYLKQVVALNPSSEDLLKKNSELDKLLTR